MMAKIKQNFKILSFEKDQQKKFLAYLIQGENEEAHINKTKIHKRKYFLYKNKIMRILPEIKTPERKAINKFLKDSLQNLNMLEIGILH